SDARADAGGHADAGSDPCAHTHTATHDQAIAAWHSDTDTEANGAPCNADAQGDAGRRAGTDAN
ncbi:MAG: hypothetical protein ACT4P5_16350, partial [Armatimonadota bacterium]